MKKYYCDRCGEEIKRAPFRFFNAFTDDLSKYTEKLADKDFCEECMAEIVSFALNENTCDECVQQMMDENAMLRETDEEMGSDAQGEPDPDGLDWSTALNRMEQLNHSDESPS